MNKKNAFTIQFSWIFVLIVGFFILLFVVSTISKQKSSSESDIDVEIMKNVDSILTSAEYSPNTFKIINIPETEFIRVCEANYSAYSINKQIQRMEQTVFFMPERIKSKKLYTWAKEYIMPMKITNILYVTSPQHMYVFVNNTGDNLIEHIHEDFPKNITNEVISFNDMEIYPNRNYDSYTFIIINSIGILNDNIESKFPSNQKVKKNSNILLVNYEGNSRAKGKITFYESNNSNNGWSDSSGEFIDESMLYAAIFAGTASGYKCNVDKLFDKSKNIYSIYNYTMEKTRGNLKKYECLQLYEKELIPRIGVIIEALQNNNYTSIYLTSIDLNLYNKRLLTKSCPLAY